MEKKTLVSTIILAIVLIAAGVLSTIKEEHSSEQEIKSQQTPKQEQNAKTKGPEK